MPLFILVPSTPPPLLPSPLPSFQVSYLQDLHPHILMLEVLLMLGCCQSLPVLGLLS